MMFEYKFLSINPGSEAADAPLLADVGRDGWEAVSMSFQPVTNAMVILLKREIKQQEYGTPIGWRPQNYK